MDIFYRGKLSQLTLKCVNIAETIALRVEISEIVISNKS